MAYPGRAFASSKSSSAGQETVGSGSWGVVATQSTSSPPPTGPLALTVTNNNPFYFSVVNDGTTSITSITYNVTLTATNTKLTLAVCSVAWNQGGAGTCSGTTTTVDTWIKGTAGGGQVVSGTSVNSTTVPAAATAKINLRGTPGGVGGSGTTLTINMSVASNQLRAAQTTNS